MDFRPLTTSMDINGSTWKQSVASMEGGDTCMETALLSTSVDAGGDIDGNRLVVDGRFHEATSMATSINIGGSKNSLMEVCGSFQGS